LHRRSLPPLRKCPVRSILEGSYRAARKTASDADDRGSIDEHDI
jgi:hypothetical protein